MDADLKSPLQEGRSSAFHGVPCSPFLADCRDARAVWSRKDAWSGDEPTLAQRAWSGLQYSAANVEQWSDVDQAALEFDVRQRLAFSANSSTYHKKDGTAVRAKIKKETQKEIEKGVTL